MTHLRARVHQLLEEGRGGRRPARIVSFAIALIVIISVGSAVLATVPSLHGYSWLFHLIEMVSLVVLSIEYVLRLWSAPEDGRWHRISDTKARLQWISTPSGLIDFFSIAPFFFAHLVQIDIHVMIVFRILRLAKLARYSAGVHSMMEAIYAERRSLLASLMILLAVALTAASLIYAFEHEVQPDVFSSVPQAMWWAMVTVTTLGYGDVVPVTTAGRIIASVTMVLGFLSLAMPVAILGSAFTQAVHRRDFIVTWSMVARVPLFAELSASEILDVMKLLKSRTVNAGEIIARRGEDASSMFFISHGKVEIELERNRSIHLGDGHFFGEVALLSGRKRSGNVTAVVRTQLLILDEAYFHELLEKQPDIARKIRETAALRLDRDIGRPDHGDLAASEVGESS